ncbi:MAG: hypothetical protein M3P82_01365 [Bacteroidota bacterium]|nr:hypothetical protein [Bacteroidota bacterium]
MKKNVMEDIADDVNEVIISESSGEMVLVVKAEIFQATSKSDKGGIRQITGYTEYRITSYDLNTGKIYKRIETGAREANTFFLGITDGKLWYKSCDKELGFHARNPKTLDVIVSQNNVTEKNPLLKNYLSQPEWNDINRYYGFDMVKNMPMLSDNSGFVYYLDPNTLIGDKTSESIKNFKYDHNCLSTGMKLDAKTTINLTGSPRCYLRLSDRDFKDISFLKGEFLQSSGMRSESEVNTDFLSPFRNEIVRINREIDSIKNYISLTDTSEAINRSNSFSQNSVARAKRNIQNAETLLKHAQDNINRRSEDEVYDIVTKDKCVFVLSQTDATDQANVIISKIKLSPDTSFTQVWQTALDNVYRDPEKGLDRSSFDVVFSKGNPDLRTMRVIEGKDKLVFIFMLKATCMDVQTGNVLWQTDL